MKLKISALLLGVVFYGFGYAATNPAPAANTTQPTDMSALIAKIQDQIQQVSDSIPKQIQTQAKAVDLQFQTLQQNVQKQIALLQQQIQQVQTDLTQQINKLQQQLNKINTNK